MFGRLWDLVLAGVAPPAGVAGAAPLRPEVVFGQVDQLAADLQGG
jgi:hypothetical protein